MRRRVLTALLALCMAVSLLPVYALAVDVAAGSGLDTLGIRQISEKKYAVTPDVTEYEWILNNASLTQQMMGHVMEIKVGEGSRPLWQWATATMTLKPSRQAETGP